MAIDKPLEPADLSRLMRRISHDLRTPLGSISIWLHLCGTSTAPAERTLALAKIEEALDSAVRCARDLSECATLLDAGLPPRRTTVGLAGLVRGALDSLSTRVAPPAATLEIVASTASDDVRIEAEPERLAWALEELLAHAARHLPGGGSTGVRIEADPGFARLLAPLATDAWPAIRPLRQAIADVAAAGPSLALSLAWEIVTLHGGTLSHRESPEGGTLVIVLPVAAA